MLAQSGNSLRPRRQARHAQRALDIADRPAGQVVDADHQGRAEIDGARANFADDRRVDVERFGQGRIGSQWLRGVAARLLDRVEELGCCVHGGLPNVSNYKFLANSP